VAFPGHQTREAEAGAGGDVAGEGEDGFAGSDAAALHADVDLDQDAEADAAGPGRGVHLGDVGGSVDGDGDVGAGAGDEGGEAAGLDRADDLVGDQDVADAGGGEDLGLAELGAGDADGAGGELAVGDGRALVALRVGALGNATGGELAGDAGDVAVHGVEVDEERRSVEVGDGSPGERGRHGSLPDESARSTGSAGSIADGGRAGATGPVAAPARDEP
jgi:hypothetical protein